MHDSKQYHTEKKKKLHMELFCVKWATKAIEQLL